MRLVVWEYGLLCKLSQLLEKERGPGQDRAGPLIIVIDAAALSNGLEGVTN